MLYSLIVSVYKVEKHLRQCVDSILAQTHSNFELILVDDGSPDSCPEICDEYASKDDRVKVIHKANGGLMSTRKAGASVAVGQYLCFIDGDDFIDADMLETYEKILNENSVDVICASFSKFNNSHTQAMLQKVPCGIYNKKELKEKIYPLMLSVEPFFSFYVIPSICTKCIKRDIAKNIYSDLPENIALGEDVAASYPVLLKAESVCVTDYCGYMYRLNQESMTHTYDKTLYEKLKTLLIHLKSVERETSWNAGTQIDEYAVYLLYLAVTNEFVYNNKDNYSVKKKNFLLFLNDELFSSAVKNISVKSVKDTIILWLFRSKITFPFILSNLKNRIPWR